MKGFPSSERRMRSLIKKFEIFIVKNTRNGEDHNSKINFYD